MKTVDVARTLDYGLNFSSYPDIITNIVSMVDKDATNRFSSAYFQKETGLMQVNGGEVHKIYCATFPSPEVFSHLRNNDVHDSLLLVKHPLDWEETGEGFVPLDGSDLDYLRKAHISFYSAHAPVDNFPAIAPSRNFVLQLGFTPQEEVSLGGRNYGWITSLEKSCSYHQLKDLISQKIGLPHLQEHFDHESIKRMMISSGGGDSIDLLEIALREGCDTYVTGILFFRGSEYARQHNPIFVDNLIRGRLNGFGATHYLTEQQGITNLGKYVQGLTWLETEFIEEKEKKKQLQLSWGMHI